MGAKGGKGQGASREVLFRLGIISDNNTPALAKAFGDILVREHNRIASVAVARAKEIGDAYAAAFVLVLKNGSVTFDKLAAASKARADEMIKHANDVADAYAKAGAGTPPGAPRPHAPHGASPRAHEAGHEHGGIGHTIGGVRHTLHGLAQMGTAVEGMHLIGEKDTEKLLAGLVKIEMAVHMINGASRAFGGLQHLGVSGPVAAAGMAAVASVAYAGYSAYNIYGGADNHQFAPSKGGKKGNLGKETQKLPASMLAGHIYGRGNVIDWWSGKETEYEKGSADAAYQGHRKSVERAESQEKYVDKEKEEREKFMRQDRKEAQEKFSERDIESDRGMRGARTDAAKDVEYAKQLTAEEEHRAELEERLRSEAKKGEEERKMAAASLEQLEQRIYTIKEKQRESAKKQLADEAQVANLRASNTSSLAQHRLGVQTGLANQAVTEHSSDLEKYGRLSVSEKMMHDSAFAAIRAGNANDSQRNIGDQYNEYREKNRAHYVSKGKKAHGSGANFAEGEARTKVQASLLSDAVAEAKKEEELKVQQTHEWTIKLNPDDAGAQKMADEVKKVALEAIRLAALDQTKMLDDLRREMLGQERKRQVAANR